VRRLAVRPARSALGFTLLASVACSDSDGSADPTGPLPPAPAARLAVSAGADQRWFAGEPLPDAVTVVVLTAAHGRVTGERVRFTVTAGDGSLRDSIVVSGSSGVAGTNWTLGPEAGMQQLTVSLASGAVPAVTIEAAAVSPAEADYLLVSNAGAGRVLALFLGYSGPDEYGYPVVPILLGAQSYAGMNGLVRLLPREALFPEEDLLAITSGRPPALVHTDWQPGSDTVAVAFSAPRHVPLTIWAMGNFAALADRAERDVNATAVLWATHPFGLVPGDVTINDASEYATTPVSCSSVPVQDSATINIYYSALADIGGFNGYACNQRRIIMRLVGVPGTPLLAHELGHTFGLGHVQDPGNFMHPTAVGSGATISQIYVSHFASWSALNAVYGFRPPEEQRCCAVLPEPFNP
jgi:hypothetical protein